MSTHIVDDKKRGRLGFGLIGGGLAWLVHLLLTYGIAEFGCPTRPAEITFIGITLVAWMLLAVSVATILVALAATWVSLRRERELRREQRDTVGDEGPDLTLARIGFYSGIVFAFTIFAQTVPIFYYLQSC